MLAETDFPSSHQAPDGQINRINSTEYANLDVIDVQNLSDCELPEASVIVSCEAKIQARLKMYPVGASGSCRRNIQIAQQSSCVCSWQRFFDDFDHATFCDRIRKSLPPGRTEAVQGSGATSIKYDEQRQEGNKNRSHPSIAESKADLDPKPLI
jgi:hypothetical protein